ncbi:AMSH-like ubiquitin thioesterase 1 [Vitis vinifera]|uniref:AMSH-like ubiquitin thioesterase 1 n=1 Tax=Vitis vinifera TaxID=29760 RepID=A0A438JZ95_VITVI|nr:AMSH-like ubiquitin thioesterase 1 [Vitis vinifera]
MSNRGKEVEKEGEESKEMHNIFTISESLRVQGLDPGGRRSVGILRPREETLSRHSILGPNGLHGQWQPPTIDKRVQYPSNLDLTPVQFPSLQHHVEDGLMNNNEASSSEHEQSSLESVLTLNEDNQIHPAEELGSLISFETTETPLTEIIRQPSPPPVLADVQDLIPETPTQVSEVNGQMETPSTDGLVCSEAPLEMHISTVLMESFLKLAKSNTVRNLETCGILAGSLKNRKFYVTALIIPKQESTSDSCQTTNEEEIFEVQDKQSLFPLGWIHVSIYLSDHNLMIIWLCLHGKGSLKSKKLWKRCKKGMEQYGIPAETHPTQSCFMSSVDLHTHYSYQTMLPEAIAIVMAPKDASKKHGIFRLTTPGGMSVIRHCDQRGFHPHHSPSDGGPVYKSCTDVYMNPNIHFDVIDLR